MGDWDLYLFLALGSSFCLYVFPYHISLATILAGIAIFYFLVRDSRRNKQKNPNPFAEDSRKPRKPYVHDQKKRDEVIKQGFNIEKVPKDLDAIVIGSGIGGLTTAVVMAKAGKRVLVVEQHDQAGGCCHTFIDKGYEFDVGIHYIGEMSTDKVNRTLVDQITDGQVQWDKLDEEFDIVSIGSGNERRTYPVVVGEDKWKRMLKERFPAETKAIDEYFELMNQTTSFDVVAGLLKLLPLKLSRLVVRLGLVHLVSKLWRGRFTQTTYEIVKSLTDNEDLRTIFCYSWGDIGTPPHRQHFLLQALVHKHFLDTGGYYPVGGASEIAYNMIPIIERAGGKVLVRANVVRILYEGGKVTGVRVKKGTEQHEIHAPVVISNAGVYNTFQSLLPIEAAKKSYFTKMIKDMKPGLGSISIFVGLNASNEQLKIDKKQNIWCFNTNKSVFEAEKHTNLTSEEVMASEAPFLFVSFPSAKDPEWKKHPGRSNKSTCAIITLAKWEWFQKWENRPLKKRGDDYEAFKNTIGHNMIEQVCKLFPQIRRYIDYVEIGTPVTNKHYLAQPHGEIYGLDHNYERFTPLNLARLRPQTDIDGLFLTGQDAFSCGFTGALFGGLLCAGTVLGRNAMGDVEELHARLIKKQ